MQPAKFWVLGWACVVPVSGCGEAPTLETSSLSVAVAPKWMFCAPEDRICAFPGVQRVRYGANGTFVERTVTGSVTCSNGEFGDPTPGTAKHCEVLLQRGQVGEWSGVQDWEVLAVHVSLLPNGKVLAHDATNHHVWDSSPPPRVWDPATGQFSDEIDVFHATGSELFCVGFDLLPDGNLLTSGNQPNVKETDNRDCGAGAICRDRHANRFDFRSQRWSRVADTHQFRYYPSHAALANGDVVSLAGTSATAPLEVFKFDGTWNELTSAPLTQNFNYYAWAQLAPNGKVFYAGPDPTMRFFDVTAAGAVQSAGTRDALNRNYGSYALYTTGKLLVAGGVGEVDGEAFAGEAAVSSAVVIDVNGATPTVAATGSMAFARRQQVATILADGQVLVTGGHYGVAKQGDFEASTSQAVHAAELWNPSTGQWRKLASQTIERNYHSTALLLPDGRVLSAGGGMPHAHDHNQPNGQIFSPPYLFDADGGVAQRPAIVHAPDSVGYNTSFTIKISQPSSIAKVHLIKLGTVTHAQNFGQRLVPLAFNTSGADALVATMPTNPNLAPPGYYMLFAVNSAGVPSVARMIQVQPHPTVRLISRLNGKSLRVAPSSQNNADVRVEMFSSDQSLEQAWQMVPTGGGFFKLVSRANGRPLSVPRDSTANGVALSTRPDQNLGSQQWQFTQARAGYFEIHARHSDKVLDVFEEDTSDGALVIHQSDNGSTNNQEWQLVPFGNVTLTAVESGKAISADVASLAEGKTVQNANLAALHQMWSFEPTSDGWSRIVGRHNGNVLDALGANNTNGALIYQHPPNGGTNQQWRLIPTANGSFRVQVRHSSKYLRVKDSSLLNGASLVQFDSNGDLPNMLWRAVPAVSGQPDGISNGGGQVVYRAHVANEGWHRWVSNEQVSGTVGVSKPLEAVQIRGSGVRPDLRVEYRAYVANEGWEEEWAASAADPAAPPSDKTYPQVVGTVGQATAMEAIAIRLAGDDSGCTIQYRAHVESLGWLNWVNEGATAGTVDESRPMEALQIRLECD
jgi:hypothetical protein